MQTLVEKVVYELAFKPHRPGEGSRNKCQGQNRTRQIRPSGIAGGLTETWAMEKAKRARKAATLKQPSLRLRSGAPRFYPDQF